MGDRPPEWPVLRTLCTQVYPLMVVGSVGEGVDPVLIDVNPRAGTEFLPDEKKPGRQLSQRLSSLGILFMAAIGLRSFADLAGSDFGMHRSNRRETS